MDAFIIPEGTSAVEILYASSIIVPGHLYDTTVPEATFYDALERLRRQTYHVSEKRFKRYSHLDYECTISEDRDTVVIKKKQLAYKPLDDQHLVLSAMRYDTALSYKFPWSSDLDDITYVTRVVFKAPSRLALYMEERRRGPEGVPTHHIYFVFTGTERLPQHLIQTMKRQAGFA
jgi:hypothetical protein